MDNYWILIIVFWSHWEGVYQIFCCFHFNLSSIALHQKRTLCKEKFTRERAMFSDCEQMFNLHYVILTGPEISGCLQCKPFREGSFCFTRLCKADNSVAFSADWVSTYRENDELRLFSLKKLIKRCIEKYQLKCV